MTILVDHREPKEIIQLLGDSAAKATLNTGDYLTGNIAVERKTIPDFLNSLIQKRLFTQLLKMKQTDYICLLLIEGSIDMRMFTYPSVFYGAIQKIIIELEIPVVFSETIENTAKILQMLNNRQRKTFFIKGVKAIKTGKGVQEEILRCFPGIGQKRAKELLLNFGSLKKIFESDHKELMQCKDISKKSARGIKAVIEQKC